MKIFTTFCCAALALCSAIYAQPADHLTVHFNSSVIVGETKLPAGDCDIQVLHDASGNNTLVLRSQAGPYTAAVASHVSEGNTDDAGTSPTVVLNRHGNDLQLYRILLADHTGYQLTNAR